MKLTTLHNNDEASISHATAERSKDAAQAGRGSLTLQIQAVSRKASTSGMHTPANDIVRGETNRAKREKIRRLILTNLGEYSPRYLLQPIPFLYRTTAWLLHDNIASNEHTSRQARTPIER